MRDMTDDERKKLHKAMYDDLLDLISKSGGVASFSTYSSTQTHHGWSNSPTQSSRGDYQRPEVDEQGTFYGYKVLHKHCDHPACDVFVSPRYFAEWRNGELHSDMEPAEGHMHGIHFTKRQDHPELSNYCGKFSGSVVAYPPADFKATWVLVKCALSGTIVETSQGFRAQHAQIIGVLIDGHWTSYSDYKERASAYSRPNPYYQEGWEFRADWGRDYYTNPFTNPNP